MRTAKPAAAVTAAEEAALAATRLAAATALPSARKLGIPRHAAVIHKSWLAGEFIAQAMAKWEGYGLCALTPPITISHAIQSATEAAAAAADAGQKLRTAELATAIHAALTGLAKSSSGEAANLQWLAAESFDLDARETAAAAGEAIAGAAAKYLAAARSLQERTASLEVPQNQLPL